MHAIILPPATAMPDRGQRTTLPEAGVPFQRLVNALGGNEPGLQWAGSDAAMLSASRRLAREALTLLLTPALASEREDESRERKGLTWAAQTRPPCRRPPE